MVSKLKNNTIVSKFIQATFVMIHFLRENSKEYKIYQIGGAKYVSKMILSLENLGGKVNWFFRLLIRKFEAKRYFS